MKYFKLKAQDLDSFILEQPCVVTIGNFDGVHLIHREILHKLEEIGNKSNFKKVVITFSTRIKSFIEHKKDQIISIDEKIERITKNFEIDYIIELETDESFIKISHHSFCEWLKKLNCHKIVVGSDFKFGYKAQGNINYLYKIFGESNIFKLDRKKKISSSVIRELIKKGYINKVNNLLVDEIIFEIDIKGFILFPQISIKKGHYLTILDEKHIQFEVFNENFTDIFEKCPLNIQLPKKLKVYEYIN